MTHALVISNKNDFVRLAYLKRCTVDSDITFPHWCDYAHYSTCIKLNNIKTDTSSISACIRYYYLEYLLRTEYEIKCDVIGFYLSDNMHIYIFVDSEDDYIKLSVIF